MATDPNHCPLCRAVAKKEARKPLTLGTYPEGYRAGVASGLRHAAHRLWAEGRAAPMKPEAAVTLAGYLDARTDWHDWTLAESLRARANAGGYDCLACLLNVPTMTAGTERRHTEPGPDGSTYEYPCTTAPEAAP